VVPFISAVSGSLYTCQKQDIPGNFIFALSPNAFLLVEGWLVRRKIIQMNLSMALEEKSDFFSFVPFSTINIEIDRIASECF
jgi:hypothetical protein